jgi:hypothetical protein
LHDTDFTENMVSYVESHLPSPSSGYSDGIDENGRVVTINIDKTNGMIIGAAKYAISNLQNPNSSPTPTSTGSNASPTLTPSSSVTASTSDPATNVNPSASPISSPSTVAPSIEEQYTNWGVLAFIAVLIVVCCVRFVQITTGSRRK